MNTWRCECFHAPEQHQPYGCEIVGCMCKANGKLVPAAAESPKSVPHAGFVVLTDDSGKECARLAYVQPEIPPAPQPEASAEIKDDPSLDGTDAAHPAWWRGGDHAAKLIAQRLQLACGGSDTGHGTMNNPGLEAVRRWILSKRRQNPACVECGCTCSRCMPSHDAGAYSHMPSCAAPEPASSPAPGDGAAICTKGVVDDVHALCVRPAGHSGACRAKYLEWGYAGGPSECRHGYADGIPCPRCDWGDSDRRGESVSNMRTAPPAPAAADGDALAEAIEYLDRTPLYLLMNLLRTASAQMVALRQENERLGFGSRAARAMADELYECIKERQEVQVERLQLQQQYDTNIKKLIEKWTARDSPVIVADLRALLK